MQEADQPKQREHAHVTSHRYNRDLGSDVSHCAHEHEHVQVSAIGYGGDHPPADLPGLIDFLDSLHVPELSHVRLRSLETRPSQRDLHK